MPYPTSADSDLKAAIELWWYRDAHKYETLEEAKADGIALVTEYLGYCLEEEMDNAQP